MKEIQVRLINLITLLLQLPGIHRIEVLHGMGLSGPKGHDADRQIRDVLDLYGIKIGFPFLPVAVPLLIFHIGIPLPAI